MATRILRDETGAQLFCGCGMPAEVGAEGLPLCLPCASRCLLCPHLLQRADAIPFGDAGFAHTLCVLVFAVECPRFLEGRDGAVESDRAVATPQRGHASTSQPGAGCMGKASRKTKDLMRAKGFVPMTEATQLSGHSPSTLYDWIRDGKVEGQRSGKFHFVRLTDLKRACPQIERGPEAA